jgi:hypothetical protein
VRSGRRRIKEREEKGDHRNSARESKKANNASVDHEFGWPAIANQQSEPRGSGEWIKGMRRRRSKIRDTKHGQKSQRKAKAKNEK